MTLSTFYGVIVTSWFTLILWWDLASRTILVQVDSTEYSRVLIAGSSIISVSRANKLFMKNMILVIKIINVLNTERIGHRTQCLNECLPSINLQGLWHPNQTCDDARKQTNPHPIFLASNDTGTTEVKYYSVLFCTMISHLLSLIEFIVQNLSVD